MRIYLPVLYCFMLLLVCACADTEWPQWLSGEPTRAELDAYKGPIPMPNPDTTGKTWPNLADVPNRPNIILPDEKKDVLVTEMKAENKKGLAEIDAYNKGLKPEIKSPLKKPILKTPKKPIKKNSNKKPNKKKATSHVKSDAGHHAK